MRSSFVFSLFTMLCCFTVSLASAWGYWGPSPCTWLSHAPSTMTPQTSRRSSHYSRVSNLINGTPNLAWMPPRGELSRSLLLTRHSSSHMPGTWTSPGLNQPRDLTVDSDIGFHDIKRVALPGFCIFRGSFASRHLRHSGLCDSLHTLREDRHRDSRNAR